MIVLWNNVILALLLPSLLLTLLLPSPLIGNTILSANEEYQERILLLTEKCHQLEHDHTAKDNDNATLKNEVSILRERLAFNETYTSTLEKALEELRLRKS